MKKHITEQQARTFKRSYSYKMGGKQTLIFPNGQRFDFDDREYYSGRGAKYNSGIRHDNLGEIIITDNELRDFFKQERERAARIRQIEADEKKRIAKYNEAMEKGLYAIEQKEWGTFVLLSDDERQGRFFDAERLARTLDISVEDARLLKSKGKTYVYARTSTGQIIELYHSSLDCNHLSISVDYNAEKRFEEMTENRDSWENAPFAQLVGQTPNQNHFVC